MKELHLRTGISSAFLSVLELYSKVLGVIHLKRSSMTLPCKNRSKRHTKSNAYYSLQAYCVTSHLKPVSIVFHVTDTFKVSGTSVVSTKTKYGTYTEDYKYVWGISRCTKCLPPSISAGLLPLLRPLALIKTTNQIRVYKTVIVRERTVYGIRVD